MNNQLGKLRRVQQVAVEGKTVLLRVDYNVPLRNGQVTDDRRIRASFPTLRYLLEQGAKVVVMAHLGRPKGQYVEELQLDPVATRLQELISKPVTKLNDCMGEEVRQAIEDGSAGDIFMLENLRFHSGEGANERTFASELAELGDVYVSDAFATLHRAHASTFGVTDFLPSYGGMLIENEIENLSRLTKDPGRPYLAIVGGKKAKSKLGAIRDLLDRVDSVLIGGGIAFTFLSAKGYSVGDSVVHERMSGDIQQLISSAEEKGTSILLPSDVIVAEELSNDSPTHTCSVEEIPDGYMGLDIGQESIEKFSEEIAAAQSIVWAGPMGAFEVESFSNGTRAIAQALGNAQGFTVIGGGETAEAVAAIGLETRMSFISTGGGACLSFLRGKRLPALEAICD